MTKTQQITTRTRTHIVASLRDQRADVHAGIITLAKFHAIVDQTAATFAAAGVEPIPTDIMRWGR